MVDGKDKPEDVPREAGRHEEFLELCAVSTSGSLTEEEHKKLQDHLAVCPECRRAMKEFEAVVVGDISAAASELAPELTGRTPKESSSFSEEAAEASFFKRLSEEKRRSVNQLGEADSWLSPLVVRRSRNFGRFQFWTPLAAAALLCVSLGILTYRIGKQRGVDVARREQESVIPGREGSQETLAATIREHDAANARLVEREKVISELRREMAEQFGEMAKLKSHATDQELALQRNGLEKKELSVERDRLAQQIASTQAALEASEDKLRAMEKARTEDVLRAASLEAKAAELSRLATEQKQDLDREQELLAKDRDIRELMGARDLYITEVRDVAKTGETQKAFGRVFYTKGKSLIFYAYDLNDSAGVKEASTFQAWGRRGPDWKQAFNLGMFYEDNVSKKRWVLKFNDKKTIDQIDAVFVTVEPHGGSERPTGKPLLFAYLKVNANHP